MNKKIITILGITLSSILLSACAQQNTQIVQPTADPAVIASPDSSIPEQIDISDDAITE